MTRIPFVAGKKEYAEWYDRCGYNPIWTEEECDLLDEIFSRYGSNVHDVLDLTCGTGRHCIGLAKRDYKMTGVDNNPYVLEMAKSKSTDLGIEYICQDVLDIDFEESFESAIIMFNTLMIFSDNDELIGLFERVRRALRGEGLFVIQIPNFWSMFKEGTFVDRDWERTVPVSEDEKWIQKHKTTLYSYDNLYKSFREVIVLRGGERCSSFQEKAICRIISPNELDLLCRLTNFTIIKLLGRLDIEADLGEKNHSQIIAILKKVSRDEKLRA